MSLTILNYFAAKEQKRLFWICGRNVAPILKLFDQITIIQIDEYKLFSRNPFFVLIEILKIYRKLIYFNFEKIVIGNFDFRYKLLVLFLFCKKRVQLFRDDKAYSRAQGRFHGYEYAKLFAGNFDGQKKCWPYPKINFKRLPELPEQIKQIKKYIVFAPGGAKNILSNDWQRRWPLKKYVELAKKLTAKNYTIVLTGSSSDNWVSHSFNKIKHINLIGETNLLTTFSVLKKSALVVTHDSGPFHMAALMRCKVIGLFGPTNPMERDSDNSNERQIIWGGKNLPCRPCYDGKKYGECVKNNCMHSISSDEVLSKTLKLLNEEKK